MSWGKEWGNSKIWEDDINKAFNNAVDKVMENASGIPWPIPVPFKEMEQAAIGIDLGSDDQTITAFYRDGKLEKAYNNLPPTHDPYTNPNAHIYYQCNCGAILDPGTKSFAELNNQASRQGWKIRFSDTGYKPYCVKCGEEVE